MLSFMVLAENGVGRFNGQMLRCNKFNQKYGTVFLIGRIFRFWDFFAILWWFHLHGNCKMESAGFLTGLLQHKLE